MSIDTNYYLKCDLNERGWTEHLINIFYGRPDKLKHRRGFKNNLCLYKKDNVFEIEESDAFKRGFEHSIRTRAERAIHYFYKNDKFSRDEVVSVKIKVLGAFQRFAHTKISVPNRSLYNTLHHYFNDSDARFFVYDVAWGEKFYAKFIVDHIRECRTNHSKEILRLMEIKNLADSHDIRFPSFERCILALRRSANTAISQRHDFLFEECLRQNSLLSADCINMVSPIGENESFRAA